MESRIKFKKTRDLIQAKMARLLVFVLCASMVTTQRNGNAIKNDRGESELFQKYLARFLLILTFIILRVVSNCLADVDYFAKATNKKPKMIELP